MEIPQLLKLSKNSVENIEQIFLGFSIEDAIYIKKIEEKINHDVKAVEYFIKDKFDELGLSKFKEFVHFGLTSQDINNTAIPLTAINTAVPRSGCTITSPIGNKIIIKEVKIV